MSYGRGSRSLTKQAVAREARSVPEVRRAARAGEWTDTQVHYRMREAMLTLRRAVPKPGPREYGNAMPDVLQPALSNKDIIESWTEGQDLFRLDNRIEITVMTAEITRMEQAIEWPGRYLIERWPGANEVLRIWMRAIAGGRRPGPALQEAGFSKDSARIFLDRAFGEIAAGLTRDGVVIEEAGDGVY